MSKGSKRRPARVSVDEFSSRWDDVFGSCPHGKRSCSACDVCSGRGIWAGVEEVPPEDIAACMKSEFESD